MKQKMLNILEELGGYGRPSREQFQAAAGKLAAWRRDQGLPGLWADPPLMVTATIDDAMGHGLELIHLFADAAGVRLHPLGLLQTVDAVVAACQALCPAFLGLTVLQFDSEDELAEICRRIPAQTTCVAGGPVFMADPDLADRVGVHHVARDAAVFWKILLRYP